MTERKQNLLQWLALQGLCLILLFGGLGHASQAPGWTSNGYSVQQQQYDEVHAQGATNSWTSNHHSDISNVGTVSHAVDHRASQRAPLVPEITASQVASALRLTCEINRRLKLGTAAGRQVKLVADPQSHQIPAPVSPEMEFSEPLTIFHKVESRTEETPRKDIERWGPDLESYTRQIVDLLELPKEDVPFVLTLTMMYLDRASSVETPRSNGAPPCPFCTARTIHRLFLSAIMVSTQVVSGKSFSQIYEKLQPLGIPAWEMDEMQTWMKVALGDAGYFVSGYEMLNFKQAWEHAFHNQQPQPHPTEQSYPYGQKNTNTRDNVQAAPSGFFSSAQPLSAATNTAQEKTVPPSKDDTGAITSPKTTSENTQSTGSPQTTAFHKGRVSVHSG